MVALERRFDTAQPVGTSELVQLAGNARAALLIHAGPTVHITVALLLLWHTDIGDAAIHRYGLRRRPAVDVVRLTLAVC